MNTTPATFSALLKSFVAEQEAGAAVEIILLTRAVNTVRNEETQINWGLNTHCGSLASSIESRRNSIKGD
jgi:hypothetical protein